MPMLINIIDNDDTADTPMIIFCLITKQNVTDSLVYQLLRGIYVITSAILA